MLCALEGSVDPLATSSMGISSAFPQRKNQVALNSCDHACAQLMGAMRHSDGTHRAQ